MEYWSIGKLERCMIGLFDGISGITFLDDQVIRPLSKFSFFLDTLDKFQKTIFKFEGQLIESFEIL